eukprot:TRINITY_DN84311_c0_g1_i1.p1 TRINITY_DN84311_c0_g1~~TRINITY_DN84311_c0_g1_i1.p1  ORF type:complete len:567 (-),score=40.41 TRINITY_DN84311_c0_g1_i1:23-1588(-)
MLTASQVDVLSTKLAAALVTLRGKIFTKSDAIAVYMQNIPQYMLTMLAAWKLGCPVANINPMSTNREMRYILSDSRAVVLIAQPTLRGVMEGDLSFPSVEQIVWADPCEFLPPHSDSYIPVPLQEDINKNNSRVKPTDVKFSSLLHGQTTTRLPPVQLEPQDVAFLTYTSGTTGPPKAAMNTHFNVVFQSYNSSMWCSLTTQDVILGLAPFAHITGLILYLATSIQVGCPLVYVYRFHPTTSAQLCELYKATYTTVAITALTAWLHAEDVTRNQLRTITKLFSGGAPIASSIVETFEKRFGLTIRPNYGLTEVTSHSHATPLSRYPKIHKESGAIAVGVAMLNMKCRVVDDNGQNVPNGSLGEVLISGPGVFGGYLNKPQETAKAVKNGELYTGDIGWLDDEGWLYVVDRKKDLIIASGFKVWPKDVEDVLYKHPKVKEVAVVGEPDEYRGETVVAYVSLKAGEDSTSVPEELIAYGKEKMAAYKYPRKVYIVDEIPKSIAGKILRRELREKGKKAPQAKL